MIQFSYTTIKPAEFFTVTFNKNTDEHNQIKEKKNALEIKNKSKSKRNHSTENNKKQNKKNYSFSIIKDYSYVPFVPASEYYNNNIREDGSYGTHLYRDCFGRFYDNCCYDNMD